MKTTLEKVFETLNKVELKSEKVELQSDKYNFNKVDDLISYAKSNKGDAYDELSKLSKLARSLLKIVMKKLQVNDEKFDEAKKLEKISNELGAKKIINDLKKANDLLKLQRKNLNEVRKLIQRATQDKI